VRLCTAQPGSLACVRNTKMLQVKVGEVVSLEGKSSSTRGVSDSPNHMRTLYLVYCMHVNGSQKAP